MASRELREMEVLMARNGYDPRDAKKLQKEGVGPTELESRLRHSGVGSLEYTHGFKRLIRNPRSTRSTMASRRYGQPTAKQKKYISRKIPLLIDEGYPQKQAIAVAYSMAGVKPKGSRRNPSSDPYERISDGARELALYAENDEPLYRQMIKPIQKNLARKIKKGTYDRTLALKAWGYLADTAAKKYAGEYGGDVRQWNKEFPPEDRKQFAKLFRDDFEAEVKSGGVEQFLK